MYIEKNTLAIIILSLTAGLMLLANISQPVARADNVIKDRDYQLVTGSLAGGGDALYVMDNRAGLMAVFVYDPSVRGIRARNFTALANIFGAPR